MALRAVLGGLLYRLPLPLPFVVDGAAAVSLLVLLLVGGKTIGDGPLAPRGT